MIRAAKCYMLIPSVRILRGWRGCLSAAQLSKNESNFCPTAVDVSIRCPLQISTGSLPRITRLTFQNLTKRHLAHIHICCETQGAKHLHEERSHAPRLPKDDFSDAALTAWHADNFNLSWPWILTTKHTLPMLSFILKQTALHQAESLLFFKEPIWLMYQGRITMFCFSPLIRFDSPASIIALFSLGKETGLWWWRTGRPRCFRPTLNAFI